MREIRMCGSMRDSHRKLDTRIQVNTTGGLKKVEDGKYML